MEMSKDKRWLPFLRSHLETVFTNGVDRAGTHPSLMWYANLDTRDGTPLPRDNVPTNPRYKGLLGAPGGCSLYWDQPTLIAAHALAELVGEEKLARAADEYVRGFTERCLSRSGILLWGNHYYFDPARNETMRTIRGDEPVPCDPDTEMGEFHETRPIPPAWELPWRINPAMTEEAVLGAAQWQVVNPETGQFNRFAKIEEGAAFLGSGGILVESLAWLVRNVEGNFPMQLARTVASYSFVERNLETGLLPTNPAEQGWDQTTATSEVGVWAGCLVRAAALAGEPDWVGLADEAMSAWLKCAFDPETGSFFGKLDVATGKPILGVETQPGQPDDYVNIWQPHLPTHDCGLQAAEACYLLYGETEDPEYATACQRWRDLIAANLPANSGAGTYAEHYGRAIHFLQGCSEEWPDEGYAELARKVADEAVEKLWAGKMFRSSPAQDACRASEGIGYLLLALLYLHTEREPHMMGSGW